MFEKCVLMRDCQRSIAKAALISCFSRPSPKPRSGSPSFPEREGASFDHWTARCEGTRDQRVTDRANTSTAPRCECTVGGAADKASTIKSLNQQIAKKASIQKFHVARSCCCGLIWIEKTTACLICAVLSRQMLGASPQCALAPCYKSKLPKRRAQDECSPEKCENWSVMKRCLQSSAKWLRYNIEQVICKYVFWFLSDSSFIIVLTCTSTCINKNRINTFCNSTEAYRCHFFLPEFQHGSVYYFLGRALGISGFSNSEFKCGILTWNSRGVLFQTWSKNFLHSGHPPLPRN